jgi:hypothetical protein
MRKSAVLLLCLLFWSCNSKRPNGTASRSEGQGGSVAAAASGQGGGKILGNDNPPALFPVKVDDKYGYMDKTGKLVLKAEYSGASRFSEGLAAVQLQKGGRVGYIDETGSLVIPVQFDLADPFSDGLAAFMKDHQWGFLDRTGQIVIPAKFVAVSRFTQGMAAVGGQTGSVVGYTYINRKGESQVDPNTRFELAMPFGEGLAPVRTLGQMIRYVDQSWKTVVPPQFMAAGESSEGFAPVQTRVPEGMRWGYISKDGKLAITPHYYEALPFLEGLAAVQAPTGKWGFINHKDTMVIAPKFDSAAPFTNGIAQVYVGQAIGYIDPTGKYVWEPK